VEEDSGKSKLLVIQMKTF